MVKLKENKIIKNIMKGGIALISVFGALRLFKRYKENGKCKIS